jgi:hypothetical protein
MRDQGRIHPHRHGENKDGCNDGTPQEFDLTGRKKIKLALRLEVAIRRSEKRIMRRLDEFDRKVMARLGDGA